MIGSFLTRGLVLFFGYAYPAYECFKTVELNKPDIPQLRFWCQYWIIVATMAVSERIGDAFISWIPMYSEAKLAFYIYLWFPKTKVKMPSMCDIVCGILIFLVLF
nr:HVA22-like protein I [Ipomoea batatas]GME06170.1 HVA22-like protein I [Ipomoea batatas]